MRRLAAILGATLALSTGGMRVAHAQGEGGGAAVSKSISEKLSVDSRVDITPEVQASAETSRRARAAAGLVERFVDDQRNIWTSPRRLQFSDTEWLVPLSGITAGLFVTDSDFSRHLSHNPKTLSHYSALSNAGLAALVGGAGGMWVLGHFNHNDHWGETGFLAGEAAVNSLALTETLKYSLRRERPFQGDGTGPFFRSGGTSFPSEHSAAAWSVASIVAHEYPGPLTKILAYGAASLVSYSRVRAEKHFPSDVVIGALLGELVAHEVFRHHHDPELGGAVWNDPADMFSDDGRPRPGFVGSPYVPLDSWIYPAIERLAALGYIDAAFLGIRPWTRIECAQLIGQAGDKLEDRGSVSPEANRLYDELSTEFQDEETVFSRGKEQSLHLESVYTRTTEITGPALDDSYHFGQTIINDYGRPYERGFSTVEGLSGWGTAGPFTIYMRGEYQHAPSAPGFSQATQNLIAALDSNPVQPAASIPATNQFRLLDTYAAMSVANWDLSFGKQSLWWGPEKGGPLLFSDNAEPIYMFRASRVAPFALPGIFRHMGPMKWDLFIGKLSGNEFPPGPVIHGEKITFKPTKNLEIGLARMAEIGGAGRALTPAAFWHSYTSPRESDLYSSNANPGKRTAGLDFSYRVPFLRDWLTLYSGSISPDDVSPISAPRRSAVSPGIYLTHFPRISRLDLRVEAVNTNTPSSSSGGQFVYSDNFYHDLSTNKKNIIGSWIGREGQGLQAWTTYWFSARSSLQFGYRHAKVASDFIPWGETSNDGSVSANFWVRRNLDVSAFVQHEIWLAPVLARGPQTNWTSSFEITFQPHGWSFPFRSGGRAHDHGTGQVDKDVNR